MSRGALPLSHAISSSFFLSFFFFLFLSRADDIGEALSKTRLKTVIPGPVYVWPESKHLSQSKNVIRVKKRRGEGEREGGRERGRKGGEGGRERGERKGDRGRWGREETGDRGVGRERERERERERNAGVGGVAMGAGVGEGGVAVGWPGGGEGRGAVLEGAEREMGGNMRTPAGLTRLGSVQWLSSHQRQIQAGITRIRINRRFPPGSPLRAMTGFTSM